MFRTTVATTTVLAAALLGLATFAFRPASDPGEPAPTIPAPAPTAAPVPVARVSDAGDDRIASLELDLHTLRRELAELRAALEAASTPPARGRRAAPPVEHDTTAHEPVAAISIDEVERQLDEAELGAIRGVLDAEGRFAREAADPRATGRFRDDFEAGLAEHGLTGTAVETFECGRSTCRVELRLDDSEERSLAGALVPMLLGVEGPIDVFPDEESGRLLVFAQRDRSNRR